ncbi:alcohol dehydrogenase [NADP(+)]-like isoform X2 [Anoplophora glabripennis]|uniref:alcohol dehydrogenase [NADP(+)]-like isoform X2 n=1 Tax=Anoplophora glabripennis TaxID=217634 RepID=UPI0008735D7F|nr:alcohol dehydrogenase [NADP(+)]-like isoform X2 [Anoplophora glabripennis]
MFEKVICRSLTYLLNIPKCSANVLNKPYIKSYTTHLRPSNLQYHKNVSGHDMPIVGLGTWRAQPEEVENAVSVALEEGYRHIDTAFNYNNEESIGNALQKWFSSGKGKREDLFITTKLPNFGNRPKDVKRFLKMSLERLKLGYVDLYLVHMPFSFHLNEANLTPSVNEDGSFSLDTESDIVETWKVMEQQVKDGLTKAIGLSNFNAAQINKIYENAEIKPAVLQVELHAYLQQKELRDTCKKLNVAVTAYSPLGSPGANVHFNTKYNYSLDDFPDILGHPTVTELAEKYKKSPGQVLLRHLTQQDVIVIPKSGNPDRIKANIDIFDFELNDEDIEKLDVLDRGEKGRIFNFLFFKGVEKHPEYPFKVDAQ